MRRISAQYTITNTGAVFRRAIITTDDEGRITGIEDTGGNLKETAAIEFYNGLIIPGFINCHCHLELSHLQNSIPQKKGLHRFIEEVRNNRDSGTDKVLSSASSEDSGMFRKGISACADICNNSSTFDIKLASPVRYLNFIEVFGIDPFKAEKRINEALYLASEAGNKKLQCQVTPHSPYSVSTDLFELLKKNTAENRVSSIHFLESPHEKEFLEKHTGPILDSYNRSGLVTGELRTVNNGAEAVFEYMSASGNIILVHNTFINRDDLNILKKRDNIYFCLCPNSNIFIEGKLPPVDLLIENKCEIVIGTDSLASNSSLDIMEELKTLQFAFPKLTVFDLIQWSTINGARALCFEDELGTIQTGKKPGLLLLKDVDLQNMKLTHESSVTRLV